MNEILRFAQDDSGRYVQANERLQLIAIGRVKCYYQVKAPFFFQREDRVIGQGLAGRTRAGGAEAKNSKYYPYGKCLKSQGNLGTDHLFTGQKLDSTGLYYYGARYYDPLIGRFISPDSLIQNYSNPQNLNRYSYCVNNPLKYKDDSGHFFWGPIIGAAAYTSTVVISNIITHPEGNLFHGWSLRDCLAVVAVSTITCGVGGIAASLATTGTLTVGEAAFLTTYGGLYAGSLYYQYALEEGEAENSARDALLYVSSPMVSAYAGQVNNALSLVTDTMTGLLIENRERIQIIVDNTNVSSTPNSEGSSTSNNSSGNNGNGGSTGSSGSSSYEYGPIQEAMDADVLGAGF